MPETEVKSRKKCPHCGLPVEIATTRGRMMAELTMYCTHCGQSIQGITREDAITHVLQHYFTITVDLSQSVSVSMKGAAVAKASVEEAKPES